MLEPCAKQTQRRAGKSPDNVIYAVKLIRLGMTEESAKHYETEQLSKEIAGTFLKKDTREESPEVHMLNDRVCHYCSGIRSSCYDQ